MDSASLETLVKPLLPAGYGFVKADHLAELWAGYGHIYRLHLVHSSSNGNTSGRITKILKIISPPCEEDQDEGHLRKLLSYQVESNFYRFWGSTTQSRLQQSRSKCHVPELFASSSSSSSSSNGWSIGGEHVLIMEDLSIRYPIFAERRGVLTNVQLSRAIEWLACFHASTWDVESSPIGKTGCPAPLVAVSGSQKWDGQGLWMQGGYSYLATRQSELASIDPKKDIWGALGLHAASDLPTAVDWCLNNPPQRSRLSLIHGDVKAANMAFTASSTSSKDDGDGDKGIGMAMYDFQYVGKGLGVQDLAKFFTTSINPRNLILPNDEQKLLRQYHKLLLSQLRNSCPSGSPDSDPYPYEDLQFDWELALVSWVRFLAGWSGGFWGNVDWLTNRVQALLKDPAWTRKVLDRWKQRPTS